MRNEKSYVLGMIVLASSAITDASAYSITAEAQALGNGDPNVVHVGGVFADTVTSAAFNTGLAVSGSGLPGSGQAFAFADLATGKLRGSGTVTDAGFAAVNLGFQDLLHFVLPNGMTQVTIGFSMTVHGTRVGNDSAFASISLGGVTSSSGHAGTSNILGQTYADTLTVTHNMDAWLTAMVNFAMVGEGSFDLLHTAAVSLDLPSGVTFTSESGVFLTALDNSPVPLPSTALLLFAGWCGLRRLRHCPEQGTTGCRE